MAQEMFLEYMQHILNEGITFKSNTFKFIILRKSIPIEAVQDNLKSYIEPADPSGKIDDNELKVFSGFLDTMRKDSYTRIKAYQENEIVPLM